MSNVPSNFMTDVSDPSRRALVVVGMHRSGTSAMTRMLSLLGASLPKNLMPAHEANLGGFWESQRIADLNDEILRASDSYWDDVFAFRPRDYLSNFDQLYLGRAGDVLEEEYNASELIVVKDPRISVLTRFWERALSRTGYLSNYVVMVRNPLEVAESLRKRDGFPREKSLLLWCGYMIAIERDTRARDRVFVSYDQLMSDWRAVQRTVELSIGIPFPRDTAAAAIEIDRYLDRQHRHHNMSFEDIFAREDVSSDVKTLARLFFDATQGVDIDAASIEAVSGRLAELDGLVGPLLADLKKRADGLAAEFATLNEAHAGARGHADALAEQLVAEQAARQADADVFAEQLAAQQAALLAETEQHQQEITALRERIAAVESEHHCLSAELETNLRDADALGERMAALDAERATLAEQLFAEQEARQTEAEHHHRELTALSEQTAIVESERDRLAAELETKMREVDALGKTTASLEVEREGLTSEINDKKNEINSLRVESDRLRTQFETAQDSVTELQRRLSHVTDEQLRSQQSLNRLEGRVEELLTAVSARENQIAELESNLRQRQEENAQAWAELDRERMVRSELEDSVAEFSALEEQVEQLRQAVDETTAREAELNSELFKMRRSSEQLVAQLSDANARIEQSEGRAEASTQVARLFKMEKEDAEERVAAIEFELKKLECRLDEKSAAADESAKRSRQLASSLEAVESLRQLAHTNAERALGDLKVVQSELENTQGRLSERYEELALLGRMLLEEEERRAMLEERTRWLRSVTAELLRKPKWWWHFIPHAWRRRKELDRLAQAGLFDADDYLISHPDVAASNQNPLRHFVSHGFDENRQFCSPGSDR